jgi:dipeptidyl aminopeptidase/acylaminoacyl peptidase
MAERRPIQYRARDGMTIEGFLTVPAHPAGTRLPLIVMPHGGPHFVRDNWYFDSDAQFLASRGYAVLQPNFRGSSGRGDKFKHAGYRQWGAAMMDDIVDGVKWAGSQPDVDMSRVCTFGGSFGGYAALMLTVREPAMFKCAVGFAGVYDLARIYDEKRVHGHEAAEAFYRKTIGEDKGELARFSPARQADKIKVPVLLIHGEKDEVAPIEQFDVMNEALTKAGHPPETMRVAKESHGFFDEDNQAAMLQRLETFFAKYLGQK